MFILGICYGSKRSTHRWWHFLRSPSSHWIGRSLTNRAAEPGATEASTDRPLLRPTAPAQRASLLTSSLLLISRLQWSDSPRLSLMPRSAWSARVWTSCKGGSEREVRAWCVCMWGVVLPPHNNELTTNIITLFICFSLRLTKQNISIDFLNRISQIFNFWSSPPMNEFT